jgi:hypothetical protein
MRRFTGSPVCGTTSSRQPDSSSIDGVDTGPHNLELRPSRTGAVTFSEMVGGTEEDRFVFERTWVKVD